MNNEQGSELAAQRWPWMFGWLLLISAGVGCSGSDRAATFPTEGRVLQAGQPINYATVVLHPKDSAVTSNGEEVRPRGITGPDGKFTLTTYDSGDGAPAGEYLVTVEQWSTPKPDEGPKNRLSSKYSKPDSSGLSVTIEKGVNQLPDIEIR